MDQGRFRGSRGLRGRSFFHVTPQLGLQLLDELPVLRAEVRHGERIAVAGLAYLGSM